MVTALLVSAAAFILNGGKGGGGKSSGAGGPGAPRAVIVLGQDNVFVNEAMNFSGASSQGNITSYHWDFGDGEEADGAQVQHAYAAVGKYPVKLTVGDARGQRHTDTAYVHVDHAEELSGTVSMGQSKGFTIPVEVGCMGGRVTVTYPTGQTIGGRPQNSLDLAIFYPNGTAYLDSHDQPPDAGDTQLEELSIPAQEMAKTGYRDWTVRVSASSGVNVAFDLGIVVDY
jgi:PKD repeat protein